MVLLITIWYIFIALIPGIFWIWFYRKKDRKDPEPLKLIAKVFLWGMIITVPAVVFEFAADFFISFTQTKNLLIFILSAFFIIAPIEECLKYFVIKKKAYDHPAFNEPLDGIIYGVVAGLGFASLENILVIFSLGQEVIFLRFATATLMHALTSGIVGYYLGIVKFIKDKTKEKSFIFRGLIIATVLHGFYNTLASVETWLSFSLLILLLIVMYLSLAQKIKKIKNSKNQTYKK